MPVGYGYRDAVRRLHNVSVPESTGGPVRLGDVILDDRMYPWVFAGVARLPGKDHSGRIYVRGVHTHANMRDYIDARVFGLIILPRYEA